MIKVRGDPYVITSVKRVLLKTIQIMPIFYVLGLFGDLFRQRKSIFFKECSGKKY